MNSIQDPLKRTFDVLFSIFCLICFFPLFPIIATLIKLTSKGPIFYKSLCAGKGGHIIECLKFRTMHLDASKRLHYILKNNKELNEEWRVFQKLKNDPRITKVGKFLRRTSMDELPQFWNVIKGDLSVVGPRPQAFFGKKEHGIQEIRKFYGNRADTILSVRPGITGVWQVSGRNELTLEERYQMDEEYAKNHSFGKDLLVILKTVPAVIFARGAS